LPQSAGLAFKAREIEELADVYFFRPLGIVFAHAARVSRLTPTAVTLAAMGVGVLGGALLYNEGSWAAGFALIVLHGVLDSSDGQLARMTGQTSELGRVLDGVSGYATHVAIYIAIIAAHGGGVPIVLWAIAAGFANIVHAQMYDYHRTAYADYAIKGVVPARPPTGARSADAVLRAYEAMQRLLAGAHHDVEAAIAARAAASSSTMAVTSCAMKVLDEDRAAYRACFYRPVRGWNIMGDNTRRYAIGVLGAIGRLEWFFVWVAVPMTAVFAAVWAWQARADRRFLSRL
jgi:hypothetical protein